MAEYLIQDSTLTAIGDAIREKTGKTDMLSPVDMVSEIANIESGVGLNFEIVGGTTQPTNPTENMIWINTDVEITGYRFSATEPENMNEGEVWIETGSSSNVSFSATEENQIILYPLSAKQYVDGVLKDVIVMNYQSGDWNNWWSGELFKNGDQYELFTGGWESIALPSSSHSGKAPSMTINELINLSLARTSSSASALPSGSIATKKPIDLTQWNTLSVTFPTIKNSTTCMYSSGVRLAVMSSKTGTTNSAAAYVSVQSSTSAYTKNNITATLNISELSGQYYIVICLINGADANYTTTLTATISEISLLK